MEKSGLNADQKNKIRTSTIFLLIACLFPFHSCAQKEQYTEQTAPRKRRLIHINMLDDYRALDSAKSIGLHHIGRENFNYSMETPCDSIHTIKSKLTLGSFFGPRKYMILRRSSPVLHGREQPTHVIDIFYYSSYDNTFKGIKAFGESLENFVSDTVQDVNGDGRMEFVANYISTMQDLKFRYSIVTLFENDTTCLTGSTSFPNPSFSAKEKVVRGVLAGKAGQTEIYKYQWNGFEVDTVEYIYHDSEPGRFIKSPFLPFDKRNTVNVMEKLNTIPAEYQNLPELNWFLGKPQDNKGATRQK
jgi:hypothetical protein